MGRVNGRLKQLAAPQTIKETPWIGWGIIAVLLTALGFFGTLWIKKVELEIAEVKRDAKAVEMAHQIEKARLDTLQVQIATVTAVLDRMSENLRSIDNRLIKMEIVSEDQRLKKAR